MPIKSAAVSPSHAFGLWAMSFKQLKKPLRPMLLDVLR